MRRGILLSAIVAVCLGVCIAQTQVPKNSKIFVAPMEGGLDAFIVAEILDQELPLETVTTAEDASFILVGAMKAGENKWFNVMFEGARRDRNQGAVQLMDVKRKSIVWAASAGDRNLWLGSWARGGQKKVAKKLVKQMNQDLFD